MSNLNSLINMFSSDRTVKKRFATEYWTCGSCSSHEMIARRVDLSDRNVSPLEPIVCKHCGASEVDLGEDAFWFQKVRGDDK